MTIDLEHLKNIFIEESFEGLELIESSLLNIDIQHVAQDEVDAIFRAAHSIKGGSATFGLDFITELTHVLETLLDEVRSQKRQFTKDIIDLLLETADFLKDTLKSVQEDQAPDLGLLEILKTKLEQQLQVEGQISEISETTLATTENGTAWTINFNPHIHFLKTGNEPLKLISCLEELSPLTITTNIEKIPPLKDLIADECYCAWTFTLHNKVTEQAVQDVFLWVTDDCDLMITDAAVDNTQKQDSKAPEAAKKVNTELSSIRVSTEKIDKLFNMIGELVITQSMLKQMSKDFSTKNIQKLSEGIILLEQHTRDLQESIMSIRMVPISIIFNKVPRIVYDVSSKLNKKIDLQIQGENTELDKRVMENLSDPIVHLVRNSLDHGIELPEERIKNGKPETGVLLLKAYHQGGNIMIEVHDDGAGLNHKKILAKAQSLGLVGEQDQLSDEEANQLIFRPGFSTADQVSDISGRGVGTDVVQKNIKELGGDISVSSVSGKGSIFTIQLPLTLAILDGQLVRVQNQTYVMPVLSIVETLQMQAENIKVIGNHFNVYRFRDEFLPIIKLNEIFHQTSNEDSLEKKLLVIVENNDKKAGILVDELSNQQQVVIKSLEQNYHKVYGISGATILGDGKVALILDVFELINAVKKLYDQEKTIKEVHG